MKFAGRINSLVFQTKKSVYDAITTYQHMNGITHLEFNYPEHIVSSDITELKRVIGSMPVNGIATRFKMPFIGGEFTNKSIKIRDAAIDLCKGAIDACRELHGHVVTIWQAYDGFDYPFQVDYEKNWDYTIEALQSICDYGKDLKISIEYKPFEPRSYAQLDSVGSTLLAIKEIDRPNIGITLDFCHMLMKHDNPGTALALAAKDKKVFGLHMNDGYGLMDNGLIFGTVNTSKALEFVYYLNRYQYDGVVFFVSLPIRENASE